MTCALYAPQRPRFEVINISKVLFVIFSFSLSLKRGCIILSPFLAIEVKISQEYSAYNLEASVAETARFILLAATSSIALVIFLVFFTLFILLLISLVPAIIISYKVKSYKVLKLLLKFSIAFFSSVSPLSVHILLSFTSL